jgi:hypothetical protein
MWCAVAGRMVPGILSGAECGVLLLGDGSWYFEWYRVWCAVAGRMVPGILKDYSAFLFRGNQSMKNGERLLLKMNATQAIKNRKPLAQWHIAE